MDMFDNPSEKMKDIKEKATDVKNKAQETVNEARGMVEDTKSHDDTKGKDKEKKSW